MKSKKPLVKDFAQFGINNSFFIWGGWKESGLSNSLWSFDMSSSTWKEVDEGETIPEARHSMAYASNGDKLYIFGGISASGFLNDVWEFNSQTRKWRELKISSSGEGPKPCCWAGMLVFNGCAVVYGGDTGISTDSKLRMFRTKIDDTYPVWEEVKITDRYGNDSNVPESRSNYGHSTFVSSDGAYSYIFGGCPVNKIRNEFNSLLILDCSQVTKSGSGTLTARFKTIKPKETNETGEKDLFRVDCGCATDKDGNLFIFGGRTQQGINSDLIVVMKEDMKFDQTEEEMNSNESIKRRREFRKKILNDEHQVKKIRNSEMKKISTVPKISKNSNEYEPPFVSVLSERYFAPSPRINPIVGKFFDQFFIYGGRDPVTGEIFNDFFGFNMKGDEWSELPADSSSVTRPARELAAICFKNGRLLIFGGLGPNPHTGKTEPSNELWEYEIMDSWRLLGKDSHEQPKPVFGASATLFMDYLIVLGGKLSDGTLSQDLSVFNFGTGTWKIHSEGVEAFKPAIFVMNMNIPNSSNENIMNESSLKRAKNLASINSKGYGSLPHYSEADIANKTHIIKHASTNGRPVLVSVGGQTGKQPFISFSLWDPNDDFKLIKNSTLNSNSKRKNRMKSNEFWRYSGTDEEREENDEDLIFHHIDGLALPMRNRVLMFGGKKGELAMDTFKIIEFDEFGKAKVTEDDGSVLGKEFHLDIVEAGCTLVERSVFCFGGRQVNKDRTIIPGAVDKFRFFNLTNAFPCALGSKENENHECVECDDGEFCDDNEKIECKKCPPGTHDRYGDAKYTGCSPVPKGHFTNESRSENYKNCSNGFSCPIGSAAENKGYENKTILSQPSSLEPFKFESLIKMLAIAIPVCVGVLIAILLLCFPTKAHLFKLDRFSDKYVDSIDPVTHSSVKYIRKTTLGGLLSIIGISLVFGETQSYVDSLTDYTSKGITQFENKKVFVEVTLIDYSRSCVEGANFSAEISGNCSEKLGIGKTLYDPFNWYRSNEEIVNHFCSQKPSDRKYYPETHMCTITFQEQEMSKQLTQGSLNYVSLHSTEKGASCRAIKVFARVDTEIPEQKKSKNKENQASSLEQVYVNDYDSALGGSVSTNVTIELLHSVFYKSDAFRSYKPAKGHLVNKMIFEIGSTADERNLTDCSGFGMNIFFKFGKSSLVTVHSVKVSCLTLLSSLGGTFVYLGYVGNFLPIIETFLNINWLCGKKVKRKLDCVFQDSIKKKERKSVKERYIEEMDLTLEDSLTRISE
ncbi:uncharacterized protein MONOS_15340 [Monocercomonoides exilis]|uniref:uncharacterized protein n=1 Tax=Monocercomonoides exilis TaxID=2049356 RepID=UPI003559A4F9|nr:hypothetical protein MONOS_15340 [Monocercomonoides exilis]|eukprot:MONOS_15340.1-p1 / transcript=MONOS_15340.1 / gene=MONOS_15340 / organism=Monocercomonoides_exilis_PA203 / gene_product=unspecified product / transcript_product=unspecified product / location=Mono_scaffold01202:9037-12908(+) / protein_length=1252 / sequence_SO=supercontig / SO=protein_coding / is_pseudo=false